MTDSPFLNKLFLLTSLVLLRALPLQAAPRTDLYEITSGTYTEVGGFVGSWTRDLPAFDQAFIELTIDRELNTAEMWILGSDLHPFEFRFFGSPFTKGSVRGSWIDFRDATLVSDKGASGVLAYSIWLKGDIISLEGKLYSEPICCDIPYRFDHVGVEASFAFALPAPTNLSDFASFQACFSGAGVGPSVLCDPLDYDRDHDVDLNDYTIFRRALTGPM